jgi:hypothetical protein
MLYFNLGVNQSQQKEPEEAIEAYQEALRLNPSHPGSWRALAMEWQGQRARPRAFAAFARFLALESSGQRAELAAPQLERLLFQGIESKGKDPASGKENIDISIDPGTGGKDDQTTVLNLSMSMVAATRWVEEWEKRTDAEFFAHAFDKHSQELRSDGRLEGSEGQLLERPADVLFPRRAVGRTHGDAGVGGAAVEQQPRRDRLAPGAHGRSGSLPCLVRRLEARAAGLTGFPVPVGRFHCSAGGW